jgi:hypothetical protein
MAEILLNTITLTSTLFIKDRIDVYQRYVTFDEDQHVHEWTTMYCFYVYFQFYYILYTVDSRYLEFDGTMEKIRVNRSSTQEELRRYWKCGLLNNERETTRAKF